MEWLADPNAWVSLATLTALEIVLGVDNIIFISILVARLPPDDRKRARFLGLAAAMGTRILLLVSLAAIMRLTEPLFEVLDKEISGRDLILITGGLFLLWKSVTEIHGSLEGEEATRQSRLPATMGAVLLQIAILDIVFSLDSVITAVGMADEIAVMVTAVIIAVLVMMVASRSISDFIDRRPTIKMLALAFLILVGITLIADGLGLHIPKGYVYFAMAFSVGVELLNLRARAAADRRATSPPPPPPIELRKRFDD